jgi:intracellular multiplication protein IcmT
VAKAEDVVSTWHWRNTMKPVRFFQFDARAGFFIILVLIHARLWTFGLMITVNLIFWILERKGLSFAAAMRAARAWLVGAYRPAMVYSRRRKFLDTGSC